MTLFKAKDDPVTVTVRQSDGSYESITFDAVPKDVACPFATAVLKKNPHLEVVPA